MRKIRSILIFRKQPALLIAAFLFINITCQAQSDSIINLDNIFSKRNINNPRAGFVSKNFNAENEFSFESLQKRPAKTGRIYPKNISRKILLYFSIANTKDTTVNFYFFPGMFFYDARLYEVKNGKPKQLPVIAPDLRDSVSFRQISIPPKDTMKLLAEVYPIKTYDVYFNPRLINKIYLNAEINNLQLTKKKEDLYTFIFCGLLMMMVLFSTANFLHGGSREFMYYAGYALFLGAMLFTKAYYHYRSNYTSFFFESYLDFILQSIGICFYMAFMIGFLKTKTNYPFLHRLYTGGISGLTVVIILYTWLHFGTDGYYYEYILENYITKPSLLVMVVIFLFYALKNWKDILLRYLFWGNFFYLLFSLISLVFILQIRILEYIIPRAPLTEYEIGLVLELIFFLLALTYKNRKEIIERTRDSERFRLQNERNELEKQVAVFEAHQEERERISADMHDELGSGMTSIRLMSEIAKNKMEGNIPVEIEKISSSANDLLNKMNAIIWSMNSDNDTVDNLISYVRVYTLEYFDGTSINCKIKTPDHIPQIELSGDKRRNIFLCVKETLNNALKHSRAAELKMEIEADDKLRITIMDNGVGIDLEKLRRFGNGLKNIEKRMKNIGGSFSIKSNGGTESKFELPL